MKMTVHKLVLLEPDTESGLRSLTLIKMVRLYDCPLGSKSYPSRKALRIFGFAS
jgi:hypothetical protein